MITNTNLENADFTKPEKNLISYDTPQEEHQENEQEDLSAEEKAYRIEEEDDLHEIQVDDDIDEPDPEGDY